MWLRNNHIASKPTSSAFESADIIFSSSESSSAPVLTTTSDAVVALSNSSETQNGEDWGEQSYRMTNSEDVINLTFDDANVLYDGLVEIFQLADVIMRSRYTNIYSRYIPSHLNFRIVKLQLGDGLSS